MWADETTRENLDVASMLNFTSCTPVRTPARTRNVLTSNTPQRKADADHGESAEDDYFLITAKNSYFNSRAGLQASERESHDMTAVSLNAGVKFAAVKTEPSADNTEEDSTMIEAEEASKIESTAVKSDVTKDPRDHLKRHFADDQPPLSPSGNPAVTVDASAECCNKIPRFDLDIFPQVPTTEPSNITDQKLRDRVEPLEKERRGTIVLQKGPEEVKVLPLVQSVETADSEEGEADSDTCTEVEETETNDDFNENTAENENIEHAKTEAIPSMLNATFDVSSAKEASLEPTPSAHDLSGVEPIPQTPDRQPLSLLCENKLNGESNSSTAAALQQHGLPSMRSGSILKIGKTLTQLASKTGIDASKQDNLKMMNSASKSGMLFY